VRDGGLASDVAVLNVLKGCPAFDLRGVVQINVLVVDVQIVDIHTHRPLSMMPAMLPMLPVSCPKAVGGVVLGAHRRLASFLVRSRPPLRRDFGCFNS
jgi:hypothetical protein